MEKELKNTLDMLQRLDSCLKVETISKDVFTEEFNNINDFVELKKEIDQLLQNLNQINCDDTELVLEFLAQLHIKFEHVSWHVDQVHNLIKKSMVSYAKK